MLSALVSRWRNWRFRQTRNDRKQTLNVLQKMRQDEDELVRLMAALMILKLDPTQSDELMPSIQSARDSESLEVSDLADEFIAAN